MFKAYDFLHLNLRGGAHLVGEGAKEKDFFLIYLFKQNFFLFCNWDDDVFSYHDVQYPMALFFNY
jgi:hypothetical protein